MINLLFAVIGIIATIGVGAYLAHWAWLRLFRDGPSLSYKGKLWSWGILGANVIPVFGGVASILFVGCGVTDGYAAMAGLGVGLALGAYPLWRAVVNCNYYFGEQYKSLVWSPLRGASTPSIEVIDHRTWTFATSNATITGQGGHE